MRTTRNHWLYIGPNVVSVIHGPLDMTEQDVKLAALYQLDQCPGVVTPHFFNPSEQRTRIHFSILRHFED